ncbi:MAG: putative lipid II flippase FtsW [Acidobacteria bacterium]|nr:putative lipid II flippase FtsW [Acidobacteriota bacterium]
MARQLEADKALFGAVIILVLFGIIMVYSASAVIASERYGSSTYYLIRQGVWAVLGLSVMVIMMKLDYRRLANPLVIFPALGLQVLMLLVVLLWNPSHHARRWLHLGAVSFQPSEFAKIVIIVFLAYFLDMHKNEISDWKRTLLPIGLVVGIDALLILREPDFGTTLALALIVAAMLFAAGLPLIYFGYGMLAAFPVIFLLIFHVGYRYKRVLAFLHPYADPLGAGFQILQSYIAVGTGGIAGVGLMEGKQKLFFLPEPQTDFIFAVISEELGLIGAIAVLALFGVILWRGLRAAARCSNDFGRLLAIGLTIMVVGEAMVNVSVVIGLLPTKGIPLPLISYGGSSLVMTLLAIGILLNISQNTS